MPNELSEHGCSQIYWMALALSLPAEGVAQRYHGEDACRDRFLLVRWPNGPRCPRCEGDDLTWLEKRAIFACRTCRKQFTVTSGTQLHRTHLTLRQWFHGAGRIILNRAVNDYLISGEDFARAIEVSYATSFKMRAALVDDLKQSGVGFFRELICTENVSLPDWVQQGTDDHYGWLLDEFDNRFRPEWALQKIRR